MLMAAHCIKAAGGIYFICCYSGLLAPDCTQLLHILPDHVKAEWNICSLLFLPPHGVCALYLVFCSGKSLLPPNIPLNSILWLRGPFRFKDLTFMVLMIHRKLGKFTTCSSCELRLVLA